MHTVLHYPFRLFFLLTGLYAVIIVLGWMAFLLTGGTPSEAINPLRWHGHEMLYGLVGAAIAGFLLTAVTNWTGCRPLRGWSLIALASCWLAGRLGFWMIGTLPAALIALADLSFWLFMLGYLLRVLIPAAHWRNLPVAAVIGLLTTGNALMHWGFVTGQEDIMAAGQRLGLGLITVLMAIIAGRIIPAFSRNWLIKQGRPASLVYLHPLLERASLTALVALAGVSLFAPHSQTTTGLALLCALLHSARLLLWRGWHTATEPLLWSLHLGYFWLTISLWLLAITPAMSLPASLWQHTLAVGAMGTLILAVMTRVTSGHTGRPLRLLPGGLWIFLAITLAALLRLMTAAGLLPFKLGITVSAACWIFAFGLFVVLYAPLLCAPRVDGRHG